MIDEEDALNDDLMERTRKFADFLLREHGEDLIERMKRGYGAEKAAKKLMEKLSPGGFGLDAETMGEEVDFFVERCAEEAEERAFAEKAMPEEGARTGTIPRRHKLRGRNIAWIAKRVSEQRISAMTRHPLPSPEDVKHELLLGLYVPCFHQGEPSLFDVAEWRLLPKGETECLLAKFRVQTEGKKDGAQSRRLSRNDYVCAWLGDGIPKTVFEIVPNPRLIEDDENGIRLNLFKGFPYASREDVFASRRMRAFSVNFFIAMVYHLICDASEEDAANVILFFAQAFQQPRIRPHYLLDLHSDEGSGKSWLYEKIILKLAGIEVFKSESDPSKGSSVESNLNLKNSLFLRLSEGAIKKIGPSIKEMVSGLHVEIKEKYAPSGLHIAPVTRILCDTNDVRSIDIDRLGTTRVYSVKCRDVEKDPKLKTKEQDRFFGLAMRLADKDWFLKSVFDFLVSVELPRWMTRAGGFRAPASAELRNQIEIAEDDGFDELVAEAVAEIRSQMSGFGGEDGYLLERDDGTWIRLSVLHKRHAEDGGKLSPKAFSTWLRGKKVAMKKLKVAGLSLRFAEVARFLGGDSATEEPNFENVARYVATSKNVATPTDGLFSRLLALVARLPLSFSKVHTEKNIDISTYVHMYKSYGDKIWQPGNLATQDPNTPIDSLSQCPRGVESEGGQAPSRSPEEELWD